jgi:hypothetical protein
MKPTYVVKIIYLDTKKDYIDSRYSTYDEAIQASIAKNRARGQEYYNKVFYYPDII